MERKIQERQAGGELSPPSPPGPPGPPVSHCILAPSGLLWLHDPGHASNYKLFQEHWRRGQVRPPPPFLGMHGGTADPPPNPGPAEPQLPRQPVLVSGLQKRLEGRLWGPESFRMARGEQAVEAVNLRAPPDRVKLSSQEFWDGFTASAGKRAMSLRGLKCDFRVGGGEPARASLPPRVVPGGMTPASPCAMPCSLPQHPRNRSRAVGTC